MPRKFRITFCAAFVICLALFSLNGCGNLLHGALNTKNAGASSENEVLGKKVASFIQCLNSIDDYLHKDYKNYMAAVDPEKGPSRARNTARTVYIYTDEYPFNKATGELKEGLAAPPKEDELDRSGQAYLDALNKLAPLMKDAKKYYSQGDYKDDNFAKGQQLHAPLRAAFEELLAASKQMHATVDKYDRMFRERELAELQKTDARKFRYLSRNIMYRAKRLTDAVKEGGEVNADEYLPALDEFTKAVDEGDKYYADHKDELKDRQTHWTSFMSGVRNFQVEAKELGRNLRDKKKAAPGTAGTVDRFITQYNNLISTSNTLLNFI